jgi:exodeoxyribonuclease V alpha subunit
MSLTLDDLDPTQRAAVDYAVDVQARRCGAITGPAGSGKTTIMRFVHGKLTEAGYNPVIAAPTGKAARRIREATGLPAMTIHMLLEYGAPRHYDLRTGKAIDPTMPNRTRENPLDNDHVICDEYAMVNRELHANLVAALPVGGRLITFGDIMQLPPIETSNALAREPTAFRMLLDKFKGIVLDKVHRQTGDSGILAAAQRVLRGLPPQSANDFNMVMTDTPVDAVLDATTQADYTALNNQIITPANKSWIGTYKLNQQLQAILMPDDRAMLKLDRHPWHKTQPVSVGVGDKVVMNKNWYSIKCEDGSDGVFNGEVGIVKAISELGEITVDFEDRIAVIPPVMQMEIHGKIVVGMPPRDLQLAYALTTHKCQGSEYQNVVYVVNKSVFPMLNRRNMYTAITRARTKATLVTDMRGLSTSLAVTEPRVFGE